MTQAEPAINDTTQTVGPPPPPPVQRQSAQAVLVLGMHRSGTSALARVLNLLGVELGSDLLPPAADNEMGFWEHREVQFIHDRVYEVLKVDWTNVSPLPAQWWERPEIEPYRQQMREILNRDFQHQPIWGVKDPRLCAMLPLWRPLLAEMNAQPKCALICRNPTEVAKSLGKRDGLSVARVYLLWLRSIIDSERGSRGLPRTITTFDQILMDWSGEVNRIGLALEVSWPRSTAEIAEAVSDFLRPSVRHHQVDDQRFFADERVPALVRQLYAAVLQAAATGEMTELSATVETVADELDHGHPLLTQFIQGLEQEYRNTVIEKNLESIRLNTQTVQAHQAAAAAVEIAAEKGRQIAELEQQAEQARRIAAEQSAIAAQQLADLQAQMTEARSQLANRQEQLLNLQSQLAETNNVLARTEDEKRSSQQEADQVRLALAAETERLHKNQNDLAQVANELGQYRIQHTMLMRVLEGIKNSRIWRWSAWLRVWPKPRLSQNELIPVSKMRRLAPNRWECEGQAQMALPCLPIRGRIRIELRLQVSVAGHAHLYFDTGHLFNSGEHLDLGPVEGEITIERETNLLAPVHCFRLDPLDRSGEFTISHFQISRI